MSTRVLLKQFQSPGDILMLTAAVRDLKTHKPEWKINVETSCPEIWLNNINLSPSVTESNADFVINSDYKHEVNKSNQDQEKQLLGRVYQPQFQRRRC